MLKVYGTMQCPDCVDLKNDFEKANVEFQFLNIEEILVLKEFLQLRDKEEVFAEARAEGYIGIPAIVKEDGAITLDYSEFLK